jgi:FKBP-type peptidyl-prolyl cis-trans isomerase FkpA
MKQQLFFLALISVMLHACKQEIQYQVSPEGLKYHFFEKNNGGKRGEVGDIYLLDIQAKRPDDSIIINTYALGRKLKFERNNPVFPGDFHSALAMMQTGDSLVFVQIADSFYTTSFRLGMPSYLKPGDEIRFYVKVQDILNPFQHKMTMFEFELDEMETYLRKKKWKAQTDSLSGIKYEFLNRNETGSPLKNGDSVRIQYHYQLLDGKMIAAHTRIEPLADAVQKRRQGACPHPI